jgi:hypothetical protein
MRIGKNFCKVLLIKDAGTSSEQIGGAKAIETIFKDV